MVPAVDLWQLIPLQTTAYYKPTFFIIIIADEKQVCLFFLSSFLRRPTILHSCLTTYLLTRQTSIQALKDAPAVCACKCLQQSCYSGLTRHVNSAPHLKLIKPLVKWSYHTIKYRLYIFSNLPESATACPATRRRSTRGPRPLSRRSRRESIFSGAMPQWSVPASLGTYRRTKH